MNKFVSLFLIIAFSFITQKSLAVAYPFPVGHQESFMANAGVALEDSPGNVIYNPAGLGFRTTKDLSLTVSGNALGRQRFELSGMEPETSDLKMRPLLAAGVYAMGDGYASVFVANPISLKIVQGQTTSSGGEDLRSSLNVEYDVITGGVAYGGLINKDLSWGLAGGFYYSTEEVRSYYSIKKSAVFAKTSLREDHGQTLRLILTPGLMWKVSDVWTVGLAGQIFPWNISSSGKQLSSSTDSANPTEVTESSTAFAPDPGVSYGLSLGQQLIFKQNNFFFDVNYSGKSSQTDSAGQNLKTLDFWSYSFGWKNKAFEKWQPLAGVSYTDQGDAEDYLLTAGAAVPERRNELVVGFYYQKIQPKVLSSSPSESIGIMFSSNVAY